MENRAEGAGAAEPPEAAAPAAPQAPPKNAGFLRRATTRFDTALRRLFFRIGYFVASHPWKVIAAALLLVVAAGAGFVRFTTEERGDKLWVPLGSVGQRDRRVADASFGGYSRPGQFLFTGKGGDARDEIGTREALLDVVKVVRASYRVRASPVPKPDGDGTEITYEERCVKSFDTAGNQYCLSISPLDLFYDARNVVTVDGKPDFLATVETNIEGMTVGEVKKTLTKTGSAKTWTGVAFEPGDYIAVKAGKVTGLLYRFLNENNMKSKDGREVDEESDAWEKGLVKKLVDERASIGSKATTWYVDTIATQESALETALTADLPLVAIGIGLLIIYVILFLGELHVVQSRMLLGLVAVLTSGLAIVFTYGFSSLLGMFYGSVHNVLPLLIIGVGVDDIMIVTKTLNELDRSNLRFQGKDVPTRIAFAISKAGVTIFVTSITNFFVFLAASVSRLPALRFFSIWAAIAVLADFFFSLTFFVAVLTFDQHRIDANRRDCCACFPPVREPKQKNWFGKEFGVFHRFFQWLGPILLQPVVRTVVLLLFAALLAAGSWGSSRLYLKMKQSFFFPDGTTQKAFQDALDLQFQRPNPSNVYTTMFDHASPENQKKLIRLCKSETGVVAKNKWVQPSSVDCWYEAMRTEEGFTSDDDTFTAVEFPTKLAAFFNGPGMRYKQHLDLDGGKIKTARFDFNYLYADSNDDEIERLETLREDVSKVGLGSSKEGEGAGEHAFPYSFENLYTDQYIALPREVTISLLLSIAAIGIVTFIMIGNPLVGFLCMLVVGFILVNIVGFMNFTGYNLNNISIISLSVSVGFACDTVVHIARGFLEMVGTRRERAIKALADLGPPVFHAAFSTLVAILVLFFSKSYIFKALFWGFFILLIVSILHGILLLPILLSMFGPRGFYDTEEEKERQEISLENIIAKRALKGKDDVAEEGGSGEEESTAE